MTSITFITGNQKKADNLAKYLGIPIAHQKIDLEEIQSLDLREVIEHKVKQAFYQLGSPVLVEDVALEFVSLGRLPGTFIKFFLEELGLKKLCSLATDHERKARAKCFFGYYDGLRLEIFEGGIDGSIALTPSGNGGFGWDQIFIPYFSEKTAAELTPLEYERFYTENKPIAQLLRFLLLGKKIDTPTADQTYRIYSSWSQETCYPGCKEEWLKSNPSLGQCAVTSLLIQELHGGDILFSLKNNHYWNRLGNQEIDLTRSQFYADIDTSDKVIVTRNSLLESKSGKTQERYNLLKQVFFLKSNCGNL